jgi:hypothetical protein
MKAVSSENRISYVKKTDIEMANFLPMKPPSLLPTKNGIQ